MLVLTRKLGESLTIGTNIKIKIVDVKGKHVKVGVSAPLEYVIHREEIYEKIQKENSLAVGIKDIDLKIVQKLWKETNT